MSTKKKLKTRTLEERYKGDPLRYGAVFKSVRSRMCCGIIWVPRHECGLGYAPASAHHLGDDDLAGLSPACGKLHDAFHDPTKAKELDALIEKTHGLTLKKLGDRYVLEALDELQEDGELPQAVRDEAVRRGFLLPETEDAQ